VENHQTLKDEFISYVLCQNHVVDGAWRRQLFSAHV